MVNVTVRFATDAERGNWDAHVISNPRGGNALQSASFADVKSHHGWAPLQLVIETGEYTSYSLVLEKSFPVLGKLWYLIKGPEVREAGDIPAVLDALRRFVTDAGLGVFAVKIEPELEASPETAELFRAAGLIKTFDLQPNDHTALLDTTPESNQLLRNLHSRGRNAVRRALREGVEVRRMEPTTENFRTMYRLMSHIEDRSAARLRSFEYYQRFWNNFCSAGQGRLYFVYEEGEPSVGAFVINYGTKGTYKDGGSRPGRSQYGDSHLIQWTAINDLKDEHGIVEYDFCGTPPTDRLKDPTHPHHGLGLFKTSFTKTVTDFTGCWDLVLSPWKYRLWTLAGERIARQIYWRRHTQPFY